MDEKKQCTDRRKENAIHYILNSGVGKRGLSTFNEKIEIAKNSLKVPIRDFYFIKTEHFLPITQPLQVSRISISEHFINATICLLCFSAAGFPNISFLRGCFSNFKSSDNFRIKIDPLSGLGPS